MGDIFTPFLIQLQLMAPSLLACLAGMVLALAFWRRCPRPSRLTLLGLGLRLVTALAGTFLALYLLRAEKEFGWGESKAAWLFRATWLIESTIVAAAFGLLLTAVFIGRKPAPRAGGSGTVQDGGSDTPGCGPRLVVPGRRAGVALLLAAAVAAIGLALYRQNWKSAREGWKVETDHGPYLKVKKAFLADVEAGRLDAAYGATTPSYRGLCGRAEFEAAARRFREFRRRPGARIERGWDPVHLPLNAEHVAPRGYSVFAMDFWTAEDGGRLRVSVTVAQEPDSIFYRLPPPIRVDSFAADYVDKQGNETAPDRPERAQARRTWVGRFLESLAVTSPVLVVDLAGVILALAWRRRHPRVSLLALLASGLFVSAAVGGSFAFAWLPGHLERRGWTFGEIAVLYPVMALIRSALGAVAYALLLGAIFAGRSSASRVQRLPTGPAPRLLGER